MVHRKLFNNEKRLLEHLINLATKENIHSIQHSVDDVVLVEPMSDGEMGSLKLFLNLNQLSTDSRIFGEKISECMFKDEDATQVIATLNVDSNGELFELDLWKSDFSPLIKIPDVF